jgi:transposase
MIDMLKRHEMQVLRRAGHTLAEVATLSGVSVGTVRRVTAEAAVATVDDAAERARRQVGRPSKAEAYRDVLVQALTEDPARRSVELLHRARQAGYTGGKSAVYALAQTLRTRVVAPLVRFEGLPGEFSQHDFGEVLVQYQDGTGTKVHFFASRLKYSRWVEVTLVPDQRIAFCVSSSDLGGSGSATTSESAWPRKPTHSVDACCRRCDRSSLRTPCSRGIGR